MLTLYLISGGPAIRVVQHIPMTNRAGIAAQDVAGETGDAAGAAEGRGDQETSSPPVPFGEWPSPIRAADVARGHLRIGFPTVIGGEVWWQEGRPQEGGRVAVVHRSAGGKLTDLLPAPWSARTRVHEYGGRSYLPVPRASLRPASGGRAPRGHAIVFANYDDQRLYVAGTEVAEGKQAPQPITPATGALDAGEAPDQAGLRFADFTLSPDRREIWCVQERHAGGKVTRSIVAVPLDGSAADDPEGIRQLVTGADFFAFPTPSPDGKRLAWISWSHPHMPWDGTELRVAPVTGAGKGAGGKGEGGKGGETTVGQGRLVKGGLRESVLAPVWRDNTSLYVVTDWTGWWNIYQVGLTGEPPQALYPAEEEFAGPLWQLGLRPFALLGDGRLAVVHGRGGMRLGVLDPETSELTDLDLPSLTEFFPAVLSADGTAVAGLAGGPTQPQSVVLVDTATSRAEVLRPETDELPGEAYLPVPRHVELEGRYGRTVHALVYPPSSPDAAGPEGERPPYVVWVHGGPTSNVVGLLDIEKAYFTSRGIGIIDVNYGGSTGYGRLYRERLRRQWGIVDVEDAVAAARSLAEAGEADPARLAIRGGSAGGWTALAAVTTGTAGGAVFSAAASYFGVADLRGFAAHTHDFESRYLDGLIGPLPGFEAVYAERAPVGHVTDATCPILLLQGLEDPIVPPQQSESIAKDLAAHGIRHAYIAFEGETHGFRGAEAIAASLEAELSFYGQILGFTPPDVPAVKLA
jgi:dipeptidyl aminopeptidase/acylaminoacyl peptidase